MHLINTTPHTITLNNGTQFPPSGIVIRIKTRQVQVNEKSPFDFPCPVYTQKMESMVATDATGAEVELPLFTDGVPSVYIVSGLVLQELQQDFDHFVAPNTSSPEVKRNELGHIISVPGFLKRDI